MTEFSRYEQYKTQTYEKLYRNGLYRLLWHSRRPLPQLVSLQERGLLPGKTALEIGCGAASNGLFLAEKGYDVTVADVAPTALRIAARRAARHRVPLKTVLADVTQEGASLGQFDVIFDRECLEDISPRKCREQYASNLVRWLAPGGTYVVASFVMRPGDARPLQPFLAPEEIPSLFPSLVLEETQEDLIKVTKFFRTRLLRLCVYRFRAPAGS